LQYKAYGDNIVGGGGSSGGMLKSTCWNYAAAAAKAKEGKVYIRRE
jgi:hypothetical protein